LPEFRFSELDADKTVDEENEMYPPFIRKLVTIRPNHKRREGTPVIPLPRRMATIRPNHQRRRDISLICKDIVPAQQSNGQTPESVGRVMSGSTNPIRLEGSPAIQPTTQEAKESERGSSSRCTILRKYVKVLPWDVHGLTNIDEDDLEEGQSDKSETELDNEPKHSKRKTIFGLLRHGIRKKNISIRVHVASCVRDKRNENHSMRSIVNCTKQHCQCEESIKVRINKSITIIINISCC